MYCKKSFILYTDVNHFVKAMTNEQAGVFIKSVFDYVCDGKVPESNTGMENVVFGFVKEKIDQNSDKYEAFRAKQSENGKKGGRPKLTQTTQAFSGKPTESQKSLNVTVTATETVTDNKHNNVIIGKGNFSSLNKIKDYKKKEWESLKEEERQFLTKNGYELNGGVWTDNPF